MRDTVRSKWRQSGSHQRACYHFSRAPALAVITDGAVDAAALPARPEGTNGSK
jgi:hypothetical protein